MYVYVCVCQIRSRAGGRAISEHAGSAVVGPLLVSAAETVT